MNHINIILPQMSHMYSSVKKILYIGAAKLRRVLVLLMLAANQKSSSELKVRKVTVVAAERSEKKL